MFPVCTVCTIHRIYTIHRIHCENCGIEVLFNKGFENIRNIYEMYTKYIQDIYKYIQDIYKIPGGGQAAAAWPGPEAPVVDTSSASQLRSQSRPPRD